MKNEWIGQTIAIGVMLILVPAKAAHGQSRACPVPHGTVASFQDHLEAIAHEGPPRSLAAV